MSDINSLREIFVNCGAPLDPGTELGGNTFTLRQGETSIVHLISQTVEEINKDLQNCKDPTNKRLKLSPLHNPILHIFQKMEFVGQYFCGEYKIVCKDKYFPEQFQRVWPEFIRGWYFGKIYVAYGEDFEQIDRLGFEKKNPDLDYSLDCVTGRFRLYTRESKGTFYSIFSKQSGIKFNDTMKKRMVLCSCGSLNNGLYWWHLGSEGFDGMDRFRESIKGLSKQALLTPRSKDEAENMTLQLDNYSPFLTRPSSQPGGSESGEGDIALGKTKLVEIEIMNNETPLKILDAVQKYFEIYGAHLGFEGGSIEQKKERLTAGENFPRHKIVSNVRTYLINSLNDCFDRMRAAGPNYVNKELSSIVPEDLKIIPTNQAFAQGLPQQQFGGTFNGFGNNGGFGRGNKFGNQNNNNFNNG